MDREAFTAELHALAEGTGSLERVLATADRLLVEDLTPVRELLAALHSGGAGGSLSPETRNLIEGHVRAVARQRSQPSLGDGTGAATLRPRAITIGHVVRGRFELVELLGAGGMGRVFKAVDRIRLAAKDRDPYVAIKLLSEAIEGHELAGIALQREARKALTLTHPNIVRVYDFDMDGATLFMTMEFLSGTSLDRKIGASGFAGLSLDDVLEIIRPATDALDYAHSKGIVHSDLKPSNVFLAECGEVKIIDFGIARAIRGYDGRTAHTASFDPGAYGLLTPLYASAEQIEGLPPDPRDDVYALACMTYQLLTGRHPFDRLTAVQARAHKKEAGKPEALTEEQWQALERGLTFERSKRTATPRELVREISALLPTKRVEAPPATPRTAPARRKWPVYFVIVAIATVAGGILTVHSRPDRQALIENKGGEPPVANRAESQEREPKAAPSPTPPARDASVSHGNEVHSFNNAEEMAAIVGSSQAPIHFLVFGDFAENALTPESKRIVAEAADAFKRMPGAIIRVEGHTDTAGPNDVNMRLSKKRAGVVKEELVALGVPAGAIQVSGRGENDLLVPTLDGVQEPTNRRVEIIVEPRWLP